MGSSAQNSSGVHRFRRQVRFNEVPEKVPKVPEKVWEASVSVQNQVRFNRVPEKVPGEGLGGFGAEPGQVQQGSGEGLGALVQSQVQVQQGSEEGSRRLWCRARPRVQQGSGEGSREGRGGFGAEPGQVQQGSEEGSGEGLGRFGAEPGEV